jgi:hypothetical protein
MSVNTGNPPNLAPSVPIAAPAPASGTPSMNPMKDIGSALGSAKGSFESGINQFRNNKLVAGASEFLQSNSLVAKFAFLIVIVLVFIALLRLGTQVLNFIFGAKPDPFLFPGLRSGRKAKVVNQDPRIRDSITLLRSKNQKEGLTYTYSLWLNVENLSVRGKKKHIFHKGSAYGYPGPPLDDINALKNPNPPHENINVDEMPWPNMSPGVFLDENSNKLHIYQNTYKHILENVVIDNIPINKWFHLAIRLQNRDMDIFINGNLASRHRLAAPPKQNYGSVFVTQNEGFQGQISALRYFNYALSGAEIHEVNRKGPNLKADKNDQNFPPYLSLRWYFDN